MYPYEIQIQNRLDTEIAYCEEFELPRCPNVVRPGETGSEIFMSHKRNSKLEEKLPVLDTLKLHICGKLFDFASIRAIAPVTKVNNDDLQIVIDATLAKELCRP